MMKKQESQRRRRSARVEQKHQNTRQEILQAAQKILISKGVDAVTLASVAGELDLTKQALYHYFPSKEGLIKGLITTLLDEEIEAIVAAVQDSAPGAGPLGTMITAFYDHYISRLDAFRTVYCQSQLYTDSGLGIDEDTIRTQINPRTRRLFDVLEERLSKKSMNAAERAAVRRLAFSAWLSALGLLTMLGVADAAKDPLVHSDQDLLATLTRVFDEASA